MEENERKAECKKKKLCCKFEGLTLRTRPQNGITLIALIITIIVMLILVGVTINVALNGGLFTQAQEASKNTQIQADKEQLLSAIVASYDIETGTIKSKSELEKNLGDGWTVEEEGSVYKVTSPKGNVFTVDANGTIKEPEENNSEKYSFKLNDLGDWVTDSDSIINFDQGKLWEVIGEDLSTNEQYIVHGKNQTFFNLSSDNNKFISLVEFAYGKIEEESDHTYIVALVIRDGEQGKIGFCVYDSTGNEVWTGTSVEDRQAFLDKYGDVVFKIEDNSGLE